MKRKIFAILLTLVIAVSAIVPSYAISISPSTIRHLLCRLNICSFCLPSGDTEQAPEDKPVDTPEESPEDIPENKPEELPNKPNVPDEMPDEPSEDEPSVQPDTQGVHAFEAEVVELVNKERAKVGLQPLSIRADLCRYARVKSEDMRANGYFSHNSPTYGSPFDMMRSFGITYRTAGENIAMGYSTPEAVVAAWMNSPSHRENILSSSYTHIGVGFVANGGYWTQWFLG